LREAFDGRHALRDDQFSRIEHLLPGRPGTVGRNGDLGNRLFVNAVIWKFRVETPWRDLPEPFWRLVQHAQAFLPLGRKRRLGESFQGLGRRSRQ
jgi:transposase